MGFYLNKITYMITFFLFNIDKVDTRKMGGSSKPLIPMRYMIDNVKRIGSTQYHLAALFGMFVTAGGLVIGAAYHSFGKHEVGWIRSRRAKFGQYNEVVADRPTQLLFATEKMASVYIKDPALSALHAEIYEGGKFDL